VRERYLSQLEPSEALVTKTTRLKEKLAKLAEEMRRLDLIETQMLAAPDQQISLTDPDSRSMATSGRGSSVVLPVGSISNSAGRWACL